MKDKEDVHEKQNSHVKIGQLILKVDGNNYYNNETIKEVPAHKAEVLQPADNEVVEALKPLFYNNEEDVRQFLNEIVGMAPNDITDLVNKWVIDKRISDYGNSRKGVLWEKLKDAGLYTKSRQNWNRRVY
jgi:hypothetical protein